MSFIGLGLKDPVNSLGVMLKAVTGLVLKDPVNSLGVMLQAVTSADVLMN